MERWEAFLGSGAAEGWYSLYVPERGAIPVEFGAIANVLPARHLAVFILPDTPAAEQTEIASVREAAWTTIAFEGDGPARLIDGRGKLTTREREILSLVADGHTGVEIAERLYVSPETVKSHVQNAMGKLGARTRAHAVALGLLTGQITWDLPDP